MTDERSWVCAGKGCLVVTHPNLGKFGQVWPCLNHFHFHFDFGQAIGIRLEGGDQPVQTQGRLSERWAVSLPLITGNSSGQVSH